MTRLGIRAVYPKILHGNEPNYVTLVALSRGWAQKWRDLGVFVVAWGWHEGVPEDEAELAVHLCHQYDLDGYIANCESAYEFDGAWRNQAFVDRFRALAPHAPLGLSYIGEGYPYRMLDYTPWVRAGAAFLPQCYWATEARSPGYAHAAALRAALPLNRVNYTLGTSAFQTPYPADQARLDLNQLAAGYRYSVWLLESTTDDYLRALSPA